MIVFPNAKINLGLYVTGNRSDGYHDIETVMYPVGLRDMLEIVPGSGQTTLEITGLDIPGKDDDNIVMKAYRLIASEVDIPPLQMYLHKIIPWGAGLGGGSSDGAHALLLINELLELDMSMPHLFQLSARLGSDCPFFLRNIAVKATGRGEQLTNCDLSLKGHYCVITMPEERISTKEAYEHVTIAPPPVEYGRFELTGTGGWKEWLTNAFDDYAGQVSPGIKQVKESLYRQGAVYASMTGSGSAVYGIFDERPGRLETGDSMVVWEGWM